MTHSQENLYDELCELLTRYEQDDGSVEVRDLYHMLVKIQNSWETIITANE